MKKWHLSQIPRQAFFYWGNSSLPWLRYLTLATFRHYHPDWKMVCYTKDPQTPATDVLDVDYWPYLRDINVEIDVAPPIEKTFGFDISQTPDDHWRDVYRSDYLRWYLLYECGGLWADMDILFIRSVLYTSWNRVKNANITSVVLPVPYNNLILSSPGSHLALTLWSEAFNITQEEILKDPFSTGPLHFNKVRGGYEADPPKKYDNLLEIPVKSTEIVDPDGKDYEKRGELEIPSETLGIHWHGSGLFAKYKEITEQNYELDETLLGQLVRYTLHKMNN